MWATASGAVEVVGILLEHGADIQTPPQGGVDDPVGYAATNGNADVLHELVKGHVDLKQTYLPEGDTALHFAAKGGHPDCVEVLITHGADAEATVVPPRAAWETVASPRPPSPVTQIASVAVPQIPLWDLDASLAASAGAVTRTDRGELRAAVASAVVRRGSALRQ